ncbi:Ankyrin-2 [Phytophthora citrophthora]|uniref:Ankyrin-2 n=1 Tax=Phytophthora citrophthora TaxID=4793 RepID=A0AAD9G974_9STRA|nr:Ankyrin-2 [Phytophthora citrophthora]
MPDTPNSTSVSFYFDIDPPKMDPDTVKRHETTPESLCDKLSVLPFHWHWFRMLANSFFARRLLCTGLVLSMGLTVGLLVYNRSASRFANGMVTGDSCDAIVAVSDPIYKALPYVLVLFLPASGFSWFEPFKKKEAEGAPSSRMIQRGLLFQVMELVAIYVLFENTFAALFLPGSLLASGSISCNSFTSQALALGAIAGYIGIFALLYYFARYRDHIMMQIGAFQESDQTGNIQRHMNTDLSELDSTKKMASVVRTRLFHATRRMREVLEYAKSSGLNLCSLYTEPKIRLKFFARSRRNPVHLAAYHGNVRALELLEEYGLGMATLDKFGRVRYSTGSLFWYFFRIIIKRQSNSDEAKSVSIFQTTLVTPLHCAVSTGQLEAVRWLLESGVPPDTLGQASFRSNRVPPLFLADHVAVARELIHGANPLVIPDPGFMNTVTPLQLTYLRGNSAEAQELEEWGGDVALTPFHMAAARNDVVTVRRFLSRMTEVDCLGEMDYVGLHRRTPLHWAAISGATKAVAMLLQGGADPNFQDVHGRSPLHWAARLNKVEGVRLLLRAGADPNLTDDALRTPLMCASSALNASRELFSVLTAAGGDIDYRLPTTGDTALHLAVQEENEASALAALANGGDIMCTNNEGLRPLDCTNSVLLLFELKRAAGQRDVMISYTHSHLEFARKLRQSLEEANVTTWLDLMDPSGIGGGSVWREEIARGITNASVVLCILTEDYASSEWCLKELALAKQVGTPILAVSTEGAVVDENLQVYLYTRQIVPFEPAIVKLRQDDGRVEYDYDENRYRSQFHLLLDGVRDEIEKHRHSSKKRTWRMLVALKPAVRTEVP